MLAGLKIKTQVTSKKFALRDSKSELTPSDPLVPFNIFFISRLADTISAPE